MTTLEDAATFAQDPTLVGPLTAAVVDAALTVLAEEPTVDSHGQRAGLAVQAVTDPEASVGRFVWAVATDEDTVDEWVNGDKAVAVNGLPAVVAALWDGVAGVTRY